jgi:hypothetical protein
MPQTQSETLLGGVYLPAGPFGPRLVAMVTCQLHLPDLDGVLRRSISDHAVAPFGHLCDGATAQAPIEPRRLAEGPMSMWLGTKASRPTTVRAIAFPVTEGERNV